MAEDTITATGYPTCACSCGEYKEVTRTYKNYCPRCGKSGTLNDSPKSTAGSEGEISCYPDGCGADYCINCGGEKSNGTSCNNEDWRLKSADADDSEDDNTEDTASTYKDMILDLIKPWDGDVEVKILGDTCYINKVKDTDEAIISVIEGVNLISDSITIKDFNPDTPNYLVVTYGTDNEKCIKIKDGKLYERFGEKKQVTPAVTEVTTYSTETVSSDTSSTDTSSDSGTETKTVSKTEEIPITNYDDALKFAKNEWGKLRRKDGHSIECKIFGLIQTKHATWAKVFIPSFDETSFMYITKLDNSLSSGDEWITSLTLADYPPSLSSGESNDPNKSDDTDSDETTDEDTGTVTNATDDDS